MFTILIYSPQRTYRQANPSAIQNEAILAATPEKTPRPLNQPAIAPTAATIPNSAPARRSSLLHRLLPRVAVMWMPEGGSFRRRGVRIDAGHEICLRKRLDYCERAKPTRGRRAAPCPHDLKASKAYYRSPVFVPHFRLRGGVQLNAVAYADARPGQVVAGFPKCDQARSPAKAYLSALRPRSCFGPRPMTVRFSR